MKKEQKQMIISICLGLICFLTGFFICTTSTDNVFIGIAIIGVSVIFYLVAIIFAIKLLKQQNKQKEDRIKKLENEVELLGEEIKLLKNNIYST